MKLVNNLKIVKNNFNKSLPSHLKDLNARSKQIFSLIVNDYLKIPQMFFSEKALHCPAHRPKPILIHAPMTDCFLD